jgi:hypothetical protein
MTEAGVITLVGNIASGTITNGSVNTAYGVAFRLSGFVTLAQQNGKVNSSSDMSGNATWTIASVNFTGTWQATR